MKVRGTAKWWKATGLRAAKTAAQAAISAVVVGTIWEIDWHALAGVVILAAGLSVLTSITLIPEEAKLGE